MTTRTKLGKYELEAVPVGQGAMGVVYKAFDPDLRQTVAIKVIRKELLEDIGEQGWRQRFKNEAIAGRRLRHPNIVPVYDYGEEDECSYIVMGFVQGRPLKEVLRSGHRFSIPEALSVMEQLLNALDHAHRQKVVHRDIKPANILVGEDGQLQVADFGIAKIDVAGLTRTGAVMGTPGYMSPEQCQGLPSDHRADIFAAGVVLYELLTTGEQPFRANAGMATLQQVLSLQPVKPSELNLDVPLALDQVVAKAMAKRREERFPSAREFAVALKQAVGIQPTPAANVRSMPTIAGTVFEGEDKKPRQMGKWVLGTAAVVVLVAGGVIAFRMTEDVRLAKGDPIATSAPGEGAAVDVAPSRSTESGSGKVGDPTTEGLTRRIMDQVTSIVAPLECAGLESRVTPSREVVLSGYLRSEDRARVEGEIGRLPGVQKVVFQGEALAWPYCRVRQVLGPLEAKNEARHNERGDFLGVRLATSRPDARYQEGQRLVLDLTAPDFESFLYVDYFLLDGTVVHLFPLTASQRDGQPPRVYFALGPSAGQSARQWEITPPFGTETLVAIAAQEPLFVAPRPEMDTAEDYLPLLTQALQKASARGSLVLADLVPITTGPGRQADDAPVPPEH